MTKTLRPYQQEALDALRVRLRKNNDPILVNASVGAGKSLIIAELLKIIEKANWKALCLTMNSTLIQQNAETYHAQGGHPGIYCAGLGEKNITQPVIFGSPHSIAQGIKKGKRIADVEFNLIVVDEAHNINHHDKRSMYMRIFNHYSLLLQAEQKPFRVVGLTGTPYRGKNVSIVGIKEFFKEEVCAITTSWLIGQNFLVPPIFGNPNTDSFDMKDLRVDNMGKFKHKDLQDAVDKNERLTGEIMREIVSVIESGRNGAFIFASTIPHANECMRSLPENEAAIITGDTPHEHRKKILADAKAGKVKYLVNVATLLVGVDVPNFDVCAWLRPTESLTLYVQGIGRVLRLSEGKKDALVLDYAGNLDRHGDLDDPIIIDAIKSRGKPADYCIPCFSCRTLNTVHARRCIGQVPIKGRTKVDKETGEITQETERCSHFFDFKECPECRIENDVTSRNCRECKAELIDPNEKLNRLRDNVVLEVIEAKYWVHVNPTTNTPSVNVRYVTNERDILESYYVSSDKAKHVFYGKFVKNHIHNSKAFYPFLDDPEKVKYMIYETPVKTPAQIICTQDKFGRYQVVKKLFNDTD